MTAKEARQLQFELHEFPQWLENVKKAIELGKSSILIPKNSVLIDAFKKLGYKVEPTYNNTYEMRSDDYEVRWE